MRGGQELPTHRAPFRRPPVRSAARRIRPDGLYTGDHGNGTERRQRIEEHLSGTPGCRSRSSNARGVARHRPNRQAHGGRSVGRRSAPALGRTESHSPPAGRRLQATHQGPWRDNDVAPWGAGIPVRISTRRLVDSPRSIRIAGPVAGCHRPIVIHKRCGLCPTRTLPLLVRPYRPQRCPAKRSKRNSR
jgi:hypothetical protein